MVMLAAVRLDYASAATLIERLPADLAAKQQQLGLTVKLLAKQIGVTPATVTRFLAGGKPTLPTVLAVLHWLTV